MFTKDQISQMKEEEFQNLVLIPLFRKMGFQDVRRFDGGNLERGKDIVMWKPSDLGQRLNFGVVVKAVKITGNAKTSEGAMNVLNQVRQMLKNDYLNPVNGSSERIQRCFVASSKEISAEAMHSIEGELVNDLDRVVEWIEPETNLFGLIEKYLPEQDVFEKLSEVQKKLDEPMKDTPYRIVADSDKKFRILGKHDKATEEMPFVINSNFMFDTQSSEGKEALEKFQEHFKKGSTVEIEGKHIDFVKFPEFLPDFMKPINSEEAKFILQPIRGEHKLPISIELISEDGKLAELDYIEAESIQQGSEEITFANDNQDVPWQVKITIGLVDRLFHMEFQFNMEMENLTLQQELTCLKFIRGMKNGGRVKIKLLGKGLIIHEGELPANPNLTVSDKWINLLERLVFIQTRVNTIFFKDKKFEISANEANQIFYVANILESGKLETPSNSLKLVATIEQAKTILEIFGDGVAKNLTYKFEETEKIQIWGTQVDLGEMVSFHSVYLDDENVKKLKEDIHKTQENDLITIHFIANDKDPNAKFFYVNWLSAEEKKEFLKLPMFSEENQNI